MVTVTVEIDDSKAVILKEKAQKFGLLPDQFVTATIEDLISIPEPEFNKALEKVLRKNKELYKRLA
ncbi:MAG: DNA-binding protein [Spirochaetota bacterium]|nr:DNA-binding protein [Spirochaetota bacterium]